MNINIKNNNLKNFNCSIIIFLLICVNVIHQLKYRHKNYLDLKILRYSNRVSSSFLSLQVWTGFPMEVRQENLDPPAQKTFPLVWTLIPSERLCHKSIACTLTHRHSKCLCSYIVWIHKYSICHKVQFSDGWSCLLQQHAYKYRKSASQHDCK